MSCWQWGKAVRQLQLQGSHSGIITAPIDQRECRCIQVCPILSGCVFLRMALPKIGEGKTNGQSGKYTYSWTLVYGLLGLM